ATMLSVRTAEALIDAGGKNLADIRSALERVELQQKAGRAAPVERLRLEARHQEVLETIETWRQARTTGLAHLGALMNLASPPAGIACDDLPAPASEGGETAEALVARAFQERPDVAGAGHQMRRAERTERAQRRAGKPVLALVAGVNRYGDRDDARHLGTGFVGVDLSWSLADGGQRQGRRQQARAGLEAAKSRLDQLKAGVTEQIHRSLAALQTARSRLERTKAGLAAAEEAHRIEAMKYEQGRGTITDLLDAEAALFAARAQDIKAANDLSAAHIALLLAAGDERLVP
ncbi:MAG TPA: TolC family protein, partial [Candidatus Ozemobacteraceae bacterium]|nr:TolC family protein [Candidatus Ozemobacteraceae bacterium]